MRIFLDYYPSLLVWIGLDTVGLANDIKALNLRDEYKISSI